MLQIIKQRKYTYVFSLILIALSLFALIQWGLKLGIDFKGGTLMEVQFIGEAENIKKNDQSKINTNKKEKTEEKQTIKNKYQPPNRQQISEKLKDLNLNSLIVQPSEKGKVILRYMGSDEKLNEKVLERLNKLGKVKQLRVDFIGSSVSEQLKKSAAWALWWSIIGIAVYIAWAFRKVSYPVPSWQYGIGAVIALAHDIIITVGVFAFLGHYYGIEVGIPFVAALLTILGYSVNDTIVVYDRTRENLLRSNNKETFEELVNRSLNETLARSINTSLTVIIVLLAIIFFGGASIKYFSLALLIGVVAGTYSSIFVATALLVTSYYWTQKKHSDN